MARTWADVLVVDDDESIRSLWRSALRRLGLACLEAADGVEALDHLKSANCAVILLDLRMPRLDGREFIERFSETRTPEQQPVIFVISASSESEIRRVRPDVAHVIVTKPFDVYELSEIVALCAQGSPQAQEAAAPLSR